MFTCFPWLGSLNIEDGFGFTLRRLVLGRRSERERGFLLSDGAISHWIMKGFGTSCKELNPCHSVVRARFNNRKTQRHIS